MSSMMLNDVTRHYETWAQTPVSALVDLHPWWAHSMIFMVCSGRDKIHDLMT